MTHKQTTTKGLESMKLLYTYDVSAFIALVADLFSAGLSAVLAQMSLLVAVVAKQKIGDEAEGLYTLVSSARSILLLPNVSRFAAILGLMTICIVRGDALHRALGYRIKQQIGENM
jgi:hypothetical protein